MDQAVGLNSRGSQPCFIRVKVQLMGAAGLPAVGPQLCCDHSLHLSRPQPLELVVDDLCCLL